MIKIDFPPPEFRVRERGGQPEIFDAIRKRWVKLLPEEWVRQNLVQWLILKKSVPAACIAIEKQVVVNGMSKRFDLVVFDARAIPWMLVEIKAPEVILEAPALMQALSYHSSLDATFMAITNGISCWVADMKKGSPEWLPQFPEYV